MMRKYLLILLLFCTAGWANDFQYSRVQDVPDLSFMPHVYTGLDVLDQMDFSPLAGKTLSRAMAYTSRDPEAMMTSPSLVT